MYARVTSTEVSPGDIETFISMVQGQVIPRAQKLDGFTGGYWLADRENGRVMGITLFESEEALRASQSQADRIRDEASTSVGLPIPGFTSYEVVASVGEDALKKAA
jgi:hypothetical protein